MSEASRTTPGAKNEYHNPALEQRIAAYPLYAVMNFDKQQLTDEDMKVVVKQAIIGKQCTKLSLRENLITSVGARTIADALKQSTKLSELFLDGNNNISDTGIEALAEALTIHHEVHWYNTYLPCCKKNLEKAPIEALSLSKTNITDKGAKHLAKMLEKNNKLTHIWLNDNQISDVGIQALAKTLIDQNSSLLHLYLHKNRLCDDETVNSLNTMFERNQSLTTLWLIQCNLSEHHTNRLREAASHRDLTPCCSSACWCQVVGPKKRFYLNV